MSFGRRIVEQGIASAPSLRMPTRARCHSGTRGSMTRTGSPAPTPRSRRTRATRCDPAAASANESLRSAPAALRQRRAGRSGPAARRSTTSRPKLKASGTSHRNASTLRRWASSAACSPSATSRGYRIAPGARAGLVSHGVPAPHLKPATRVADPRNPEGIARMAPETRILPRVLVVDDDRLNREIARDALGASARVECCASAEAALEALAREPADLVLSDLTMPGMSGTALLDRIRREHPDTDFVLLTANASVESAVAALRMGAADYLVKPIQPEELGVVAERILARRRLLAENERLAQPLRVAESCRTLLRCLDPGEVYAVALDLLLHALPCERGLAIFRRTSFPSSDGVAFRGFDESEARQLRQALVVRNTPHPPPILPPRP